MRPGQLVGTIDRRWNIGEVVAVISHSASPAAAVSDALRAHLKNRPELPPICIGVGLDAGRLEELPQSHDEARKAIRLFGVPRAVVHLGDIGIGAYLCRNADATAHRLLQRLPPAVCDGVLIHTIEAFAACDLNVKACARRLNVHTNTIYHRLNRINALTGRNPRTFRGLSQLTTALTMSHSESHRSGQ